MARASNRPTPGSIISIGGADTSLVPQLAIVLGVKKIERSRDYYVTVLSDGAVSQMIATKRSWGSFLVTRSGTGGHQWRHWHLV